MAGVLSTRARYLASWRTLWPWIGPIPGTTKLHRLEENLAAAAIGLTRDELRDIESAVARITVQGDRYPAELQERTGR